MDLSKLKISHSLAIFWGLFAAVWFFIGSDFSASLYPWDEEIYFNAARNVLDGHWLLPKLSPGSNPLGGVDPFLEKPPLSYWIIAIAMAIGGETAAVARVPSLIAMSSVIGITVLLASRLSRPATGLFAGFVALGIPAFSLTRGASQVATDPFLLLFGIGAIYCLVVFVETGQEKWAWFAGIAYGAAILSKFVAAAPFGLFTLAYLYRYRARVGWRGFGRIALGGVLVAVPWFLVVAALRFQPLIDQMILDQVVDRASGRKNIDPRKPLFGFMHYPYFKDGSNYFGWPFAGLGMAALVSLGRQRLFDTVSDVDLLMWPFAVGVLVLYAAIGGNHQWYVMPAAVPISILVANAIVAFLTPVLENLDLAD